MLGVVQLNYLLRLVIKSIFLYTINRLLAFASSISNIGLMKQRAAHVLPIEVEGQRLAEINKMTGIVATPELCIFHSNVDD